MRLFSHRTDWFWGTLILLGLLLIVQWQFGFQRLFAAWSSLSLVGLCLAVFFSLLGYLLRAWRVAILLTPLFRHNIFGLLRLTFLHNAANNLLPMRLGELVFPLLLNRDYQLGITSSTVTLIWLRLLDIFVLLGILLLATALSSFTWEWWGISLLWWFLPLVLRRVLPTFASWCGQRWHALHNISEAILNTIPTNAWQYYQVYLLSLLQWAAKFLAFSIILHALTGLDVWLLLLGVWGAEVSSVLPINGIAGAGSYELGMVGMLMSMGVSADLALMGAVNLHLFVLGMTFLTLLVALFLPRKPSSVDYTQVSKV